MVIEVRLHETLKKYAPNSNSGIMAADVPDEITVRELFEELEWDVKEFGKVHVNHLPCGYDSVLVDGDVIDLFPES